MLLPAVAAADEMSYARLHYISENYAAAVRSLEPLAAKGNAEAQNMLARLLMDGRGVRKDIWRARELLAKSRKQKYRPADWTAARWAVRGVGERASWASGRYELTKNGKPFHSPSEELDCYQLILESGQTGAHERAITGAVKLAQDGHKPAIEFLKERIANDDRLAMYRFANYYLRKGAPAGDEAVGLTLLRSGAERGHAGCMSSYGRMMLEGKRVTTNLGMAVRYLDAAAKLGDLDAAHALGMAYKSGKQLTADPKKAYEAFSALDDPGWRANYEAGLCLQNGTGVERDCLAAANRYRECFEHFGYAFSGIRIVRDLENAIESGDTAAMTVLGNMHRDGWGKKPKNPTKAMELYKKAAALGFAEARYAIAGLYYNGEGVPKDIKETARWYALAAKGGRPEHVLTYGHVLNNGGGVTKDVTRATEHFRRAAEGGNAAAAVQYGIALRRGLGVRRDDSGSIKWFRIASRAGNAQADHWMAASYLRGEGVKKNPVAGIRSLKRSALNGRAAASFALGTCYERGNGVGKSLAEADRWFGRAAEMGHKPALERLQKRTDAPSARSELALLHAIGVPGVEKDLEKVRKLAWQAAQQGDAKAAWLLGEIYRDGLGVKRNKMLANTYTASAAARGSPNGLRVLALQNFGGDDRRFQDRAEGARLMHEAIERDDVRATTWVTKNNSLAEARLMHARMLYQGKSMIRIKQKRKKCIAMVLELVDADYTPAMHYAADRISTGDIAGRTKADIVKMLARAGGLGDAEAYNRLLELVRDGKAKQPDDKTYVRWLEGVAKDREISMNGDDLHELGRRHEKGIGTYAADEGVAAKYYLRAWKQGNVGGRAFVEKFAESAHPNFRYELARTLEGRMDYDVRPHYKAAAEKGHTDAMVRLGWYSTNSIDDARKLFEQAAAKGDPRGLFGIGFLQHYSSVNAQEREACNAKIREAADAGLPVAMMYRASELAKDRIDAYVWARNAIDFGYDEDYLIPMFEKGGPPEPDDLFWELTETQQAEAVKKADTLRRKLGR
ncbi:MAG: hypothetical protein V3T86_03245 [Planctomycetota bacterium]